MTQDEILQRNGFDILENGCVYTDKHRVERAMSEWAKQQAVAFLEYYERFRTEEKRGIHKEYEKAGGMFSWIGKPVAEIYNDFNQRKPIKSTIWPGQETFFLYNDKNQLVHESEIKK